MAGIVPTTSDAAAPCPMLQSRDRTQRKQAIKVLLIAGDTSVPVGDALLGNGLLGNGRQRFSVDICDWSEDALVRVAAGEHDAILLDLPEGEPVVRASRRVLDRRYGRTPLVVLVNPSDAGFRYDLQAAGAADVLLKNDLVAPLIRRALEYAVEFAEIEERLASLALFDEMTGLPSMTLFWEFLSYAVKRAQRQEERLAVMGIYVNGLREINETRGHDFGDRVLTQVAANIKQAVRSCDAVARFGGTKFVALLEPLGEDENIHIVTERVAEAIARRIEVGGVSVEVSATIGVSLYPTSVASPSALLRNATTAMDYAMDRGAGSIHIA